MAAASSRAHQLKEEGNTALKAGDAQNALRLYSEGLSSPDLDDETAAVLHSNRAAIYSRLQPPDWPAALSDATRCVALRPNWPKGHVRSGVAHYGVGSFAEAEAAYAEASRLAPNDESVVAALADAKKAKAKKELEASLLPAVVSFAQRKQAGAQLLQDKQYAAAAAEYRGALSAMSSLLSKLPANESSPLLEQLTKLRRGMEGELLQATQAQATAPLGTS
jgi:stress-induced-phosphoprotein 1